MIKRFAIYLSCAAFAFNLVSVQLARAQGLSLIRDAEIENILWGYTAPILRVAGIDPNAATINIVADDSLNAFVAGGPNIYLFTGLLRRSDSPEQTMGVIAHEVGHIAGSHGKRTRDLLSDLQIQGFITMILGFALAAASGQSGAAGAATLGGAGLSTNAFLAHSRAQESAADSAGLSYMEDIGVSATGLYEFLKVLENEEYLAVGRQSPYYRTHPVTRERMSFVAEHVKNSSNSNSQLPPKFYLWQKIMRAKLTAFLDPPGRVFQLYPDSDSSLPARYARAIAFYRVPDLKEAVPQIDGLIADYPGNPYFYELKGQMLFENGRGGEAIGPYKKAVALLPHSPLLRTQLAQVLLESGDQQQNTEALSNLKEAARYDNSNGLTYHLLSIAYGREGKIGMAALSIAEKALLEGDRETAIGQAERAMHLLDSGTLDWLRAERVLKDAEDLDRT